MIATAAEMGCSYQPGSRCDRPTATRWSSAASGSADYSTSTIVAPHELAIDIWHRTGDRGLTRTTGTSKTVMAVSTRSCVDRSDAHTGTRRNILRNIDRLETPSGPHEFGQLCAVPIGPTLALSRQCEWSFLPARSQPLTFARSCPLPHHDLLNTVPSNTNEVSAHDDHSRVPAAEGRWQPLL